MVKAVIIIAGLLMLCGGAMAQNQMGFSSNITEQKQDSIPTYVIHQNWSQELSDSMETVIGAARCSFYVDNRPRFWSEWKNGWEEMTWWDLYGEEVKVFARVVGMFMGFLFFLEARRELKI